MQLRMKEPYRNGVTNRLASSLAEAVARLPSREKWCQREKCVEMGRNGVRNLFGRGAPKISPVFRIGVEMVSGTFSGGGTQDISGLPD
jgi:hypothetical protein